MTSNDKISATQRRMGQDDDRMYSPSCARNRDPILAVLKQELPQSGIVLEVASGTGEHATHMTSHLSGIFWHPSDPDPLHRRSINAWQRALGLANMGKALDLMTTAEGWSEQAGAALPHNPNAIVCNNMIHITPWAAYEGLIAGASRLLDERDLLFVYGPFSRGGEMVESNAAFDTQLRAQDPRWGVRALEDVSALAQRAGFILDKIVDMPANNLSVCFRRQRN